MNNISLAELRKEFAKCYTYKNVEFKDLNTLVNDIFAVTTDKDKFALKLYHTPYRTVEEVQWEIDLLTHLISRGVPVQNRSPGKRVI